VNKEVGYRLTAFILLALIFFFHLFNNYSVLREDESLYMLDLYDYFHNSLGVRGIILDVSHDIAGYLRHLPELIIIHHYRPPLFFITCGAFLTLFKNVSIDLAVMSNMTFMLILLLSMYKIGTLLYSVFTFFWDLRLITANIR